MRIRGMLAALASGLALTGVVTGVAIGETITLGDSVAVKESSIERPSRGMSMAAVETRFGQPASRHGAVGEPPITRWDYPGFSVFFEHQFVIHAVATAS